MKKDFETRFMPNVKFIFTNLFDENLKFKIRHLMYDICGDRRDCYGFLISTSGTAITPVNEPDFNMSNLIQVSVFEAMPEFIPDGMRYNKELDKLVPDVIQWEKVDNGGNHIAADGTPFDTIEEALHHNCTLVATSSADEYCSEIKLESDSSQQFAQKIQNHRNYNIGSSNYASMKIQPWDVWKDWKLDPWDADIVKRISRTKEIPGKSFEDAKIEDYEKIKHICDEKIYQLKEKNKC